MFSAQRRALYSRESTQSTFFGSPRGDAPMALTGPEKAMYNFLIKREAAGNLNASQKTALDALKAKVGPATPAPARPPGPSIATW